MRRLRRAGTFFAFAAVVGAFHFGAPSSAPAGASVVHVYFITSAPFGALSLSGSATNRNL